MVNPTAQRGANQAHILCGGSPVATGRQTAEEHRSARAATPTASASHTEIAKSR
jgi:hypothetical protein